MLRAINQITAMIPGLLLGIFIQYQTEWVRLFSDKMWVELLLITMATSFGFLLGFWIGRKRKLLFTSLLIYPVVWFLGHSTLLYFVDISYFSWNLVLITSLLGGVITIHLKPRGKIHLLDLALIVIGYLLCHYIQKPSIIFIILFIGLLIGFNQLNWQLKLFPGLLLILGATLVQPPELLAKQTKYEDHLVQSELTRINQLDVTKWRNHYWYYFNNQNKISSLDEWLFHEPLVHFGMNMVNAKKVLILGGETGGALKEVRKYSNLGQVVIVPLDLKMFQIFREKEIPSLVANQQKAYGKEVVVDSSISKFLSTRNEKFDLIICDLPDPTNLEFNQFYTQEFYQLCKERLNENGVFVTQAGSPYFATKAYFAIEKTLQSAGFSTVPIHNQVLTMGEWGWIIGSLDQTQIEMVDSMKGITLERIETKWINQEAIQMMMAFGKLSTDTSNIEVNRISNPVLFTYYTKGNWTF